MGLPSEVVIAIQEFVETKKEEKNIVNTVIREDVFDILNKECIVLFYYLEDEIDGCHIVKPLNGEMKQFVFINTNKKVQEQTWTAAHELGHVWKVDEYIIERFSCEEWDRELIVGRFGAELLMPASIMQEEINKKLKEYNFQGPNMSADMMVELVTYLMNFFGVPHKSIIRRFSELGHISDKNIDLYLKTFEKRQDLFSQKMQENQYTRLETKPEKSVQVYAMENIQRDLEKLEEAGAYNKRKLCRIREIFHIPETLDKGENLEFELGHGEDKEEGSN